MKFEGEIKFSVDIENKTVSSSLEYEPAEVDELTVLALVGTHLQHRAELVKSQGGGNLTRLDHQLAILFGEDDEGDPID